jgi:hypothetical protein
MSVLQLIVHLPVYILCYAGLPQLEPPSAAVPVQPNGPAAAAAGETSTAQGSLCDRVPGACCCTCKGGQQQGQLCLLLCESHTNKSTHVQCGFSDPPFVCDQVQQV